MWNTFRNWDWKLGSLIRKWSSKKMNRNDTWRDHKVADHSRCCNRARTYSHWTTVFASAKSETLFNHLLFLCCILHDANETNVVQMQYNTDLHFSAYYEDGPQEWDPTWWNPHMEYFCSIVSDLLTCRQSMLGTSLSLSCVMILHYSCKQSFLVKGIMKFFHDLSSSWFLKFC